MRDGPVRRSIQESSGGAVVGEVSREVGVSVQTLERWRDVAQTMPARGRAWSAVARLEAVITPQ